MTTSLESQHISLNSWLSKASNRARLAPPVCNTLLFGGTAALLDTSTSSRSNRSQSGVRREELQVMLVGGPNKRSDYHIEQGSEMFFQVQGRLRVNVQERGQLRCVALGAGDVFLLPPRVPHSPNREAGGIGIVIERQRRVGERDGIKWFTSGGETLHEEYFTCTDLGTDLKPIIERFHDSQEFKTGERSAASPPLPEPEVEIDAEVSLGNAFSLEKWIDASFASMESSSRADWTGNSRKLFAETSNQGDFDVDVIFGCTPARDQGARGRSQTTGGVKLETSLSEVFVMVVRGSCILRADLRSAKKASVRDAATNGGSGDDGVEELTMSLRDIVLIPEGAQFAILPADGGAVLTVRMMSEEEHDVIKV